MPTAAVGDEPRPFEFHDGTARRSLSHPRESRKFWNRWTGDIEGRSRFQFCQQAACLCVEARPRTIPTPSLDERPGCAARRGSVADEGCEDSITPRGQHRTVRAGLDACFDQNATAVRATNEVNFQGRHEDITRDAPELGPHGFFLGPDPHGMAIVTDTYPQPPAHAVGEGRHGSRHGMGPRELLFPLGFGPLWIEGRSVIWGGLIHGSVAHYGRMGGPSMGRRPEIPACEGLVELPLRAYSLLDVQRLSPMVRTVRPAQ